MTDSNYLETTTSYIHDDGKDIKIIRNTPCRMCEQTADLFYEPKTIGRIEQIVKESPTPHIAIPEYNYS